VSRVIRGSAPRRGLTPPTEAIADEDWDRCWHRNVMAHLWLAQAAEEELKKNHGSLVISASAAGLRPSGSSMAYCTSADLAAECPC
jgi:NAD(P)-dependent dehydrogenase (short-subunit alcohol dehydrogenase family)